MTLRTLLAASALALVTLAGASAQAGTLFDAPGSVGEFPTDTSYLVSFAGPAGPAALSFVLDGIASLDGQNFYQDDFTLALNGADILRGTFNLGGGGNDVVFLQPLGSTISNVSGNGTAVTWAGGHVNISSPLNLIAGTNTLKFAYTALADGHAGFQGTGDEGWGLSNIKVTNLGAAAVPEPTTWALTIMGFGAMGAVLRRRRELQAVAA